MSKSIFVYIDLEGETLKTAEYYDLQEQQAKQIIKEVAEASSQWQEVARALKIPKKEILRMASAFEHEDLRMALT